jgi:hypothetical protein
MEENKVAGMFSKKELLLLKASVKYQLQLEGERNM